MFVEKYVQSILFALGCASLIATSHFAHAWGTEGHRVSARVASELLTPKTRLRLNQIIENSGSPEGLADVSLYMDINRKELSEKVPGSEKWHYDNQPVCKTLSYDQYCPKGDCASAKIPELLRKLKDSAAPKEDRAQALRFLVHMIGDIHQPLHAADDSDLGGNLKFVLIPESSEGRRLHGVWDTDIVKRALRGLNETEYANELLKKYREQISTWQSGDVNNNVRGWMNESHSLSKLVTYGNLPKFECGKEWESTIVTPVPLPESYMVSATAIVPVQLAKAGARMAWVLNLAMDAASVSADEKAAIGILPK
jgi:S1/P1 Nuclease